MAGKWSLDMNKYAKKLKVEIEDVRTTYAFALYSSIVRKTPVDTGRARGNWNIAVGHEDTTVDPEKKLKTGLKYQDPKAIPQPKGDESIYISNNLDYIERLEYGYSRQAPNGMVGLTLANNKNIFEAAVERVKNENKGNNK